MVDFTKMAYSGSCDPFLFAMLIFFVRISIDPYDNAAPQSMFFQFLRDARLSWNSVNSVRGMGVSRKSEGISPFSLPPPFQGRRRDFKSEGYKT